MVDSNTCSGLWATDDARPGLTRARHHACSRELYLDSIRHASPGNLHTGTDDASSFDNAIASAPIADGHPNIHARGALNGGGGSDAGAHRR